MTPSTTRGALSGVLAGYWRSARRAGGSLVQGRGARATARAHTTSSGVLLTGRTCGICSHLVRFPPHMGDVRALVGADRSWERLVTPATAAEQVVDRCGDSTFARLDARVSADSGGLREGGTDRALESARKGSPVESRRPCMMASQPVGWM